MSSDDRKRPAKDLLPRSLSLALEDILLYLWEDEMEDFIACGPDPDGAHIFRSIVAVDRWFYGHDYTPEQIVAELHPEGRIQLLGNPVRVGTKPGRLHRGPRRFPE
jgi:hypothetical protein